MTEEKEAAAEFIKNCRQIYPEVDMMDEETLTMYNQCWDVLREKEQPKSKKKPGKLELFERQVIECLEQGFGEEQQLLEEAESKKNPYARRKYIKAFNSAVKKFNQNEK